MKIFYLLFLLAFTLASCKKLIEVNTPQNQLTTDKVFADTASATAAVVNIYSIFNNHLDGDFNKYVSVYTDELNDPSSSPDEAQFNASRLATTNGVVSNQWSYSFNIIYACNQVIEQLQVSPRISTSIALRLIAEAKFLRAFTYFYLVNTYGSVPLILTTDVGQTAKAARADASLIYTQMEQDLADAKSGLPAAYIGSGRVRATQLAASALLARVYLFEQKWKNALAESATVIQSGTYQLENIPNVFLAGNQEAILAFWTQNGYIADADNLVPSPGSQPLYLVSSNLLTAFEPNDQRRSLWIDSVTLTSGAGTSTYYFPYKYHNNGNANTGPAEYLVALRLAEQYLIRAEANAQLGNVADAVQDLNAIRQRAGITALPAALSQADCLGQIVKEWQTEFFCEWGHRLLDLKRFGKLNATMSAVKKTWQPTASVWPLPKTDLAADPNLVHNPGY